MHRQPVMFSVAHVENAVGMKILLREIIVHGMMKNVENAIRSACMQ